MQIISKLQNMFPGNLIFKILKSYLFYLQSQYWSRQRLEAYQDKKLRQLILHAGKHVPYYRGLFKTINFDPATFRGRIDMHRIPLLDKETLRTRQDELIADNAAIYGINYDSTSGSTGKPLKLIIDNATKANKLAALIRSFQWAGFSIRHKLFSLQSYNFEDPEALYKSYCSFYYRFDAKKLKKETALEIIKMINKKKPRVFVSYPFPLLMLSHFAVEQGLNIHPLKSLVTAGETLSQSRRTLLETAYGCKVYDWYSLHESTAIITECKHGTRHFLDDFAYTEIVDENGNDASKQGVGGLVGTGLYNYAMPLIRYEIGDTVVMKDRNFKCKCGRHYKAVQEIVGRQNDYIETPDGRLLSNVLEHSIDKAKGVVAAQCVQDAIDHIYLNLTIDNSFDKDSITAIEAGLRKRLGDEIKIDLKVGSQLEKSKGVKTPFILSKIGREYI
jgi:phenylacetate-CoA ligase